MQNQQVTKAITAKDIISDNVKKRIAEVLPSVIDTNRFARICAFELSKDEKLLACTATSIIRSVMESARLGLEVGGVKGESYLVAYKDKQKGISTCQLIIGYKGMLTLLYRSGKVKDGCAHAVYKNDIFEFQYGTNKYLKHIPARGERGEIIAFYAFVSTINGGEPFDVMWKNEVDAIMETSPDYKYKGQNSIWVKHYVAMGCKTVIRRLFKTLPLSNDIQRAVAIDERADSGEQNNVIDADYEDVPEAESHAANEFTSRSEQLAEAL